MGEEEIKTSTTSPSASKLKKSNKRKSFGSKQELEKNSLTRLATSLLHPFHRTKPQLFTHKDQTYVVLPQKDSFTLISGETGRFVCTISLPNFSSASICYSQNSIWIGCNCDGGAKHGTANILEYSMDSVLSTNPTFTRWCFDAVYDGVESTNKTGFDVFQIAPPQSSNLQHRKNKEVRELYVLLQSTQKDDNVSILSHVSLPLLDASSRGTTKTKVKVSTEKMSHFKSNQSDVLLIQPLHSGDVLIVTKKTVLLAKPQSSRMIKAIVTELNPHNPSDKTKFMEKKDDGFFGEEISSATVSPEGNDLALGFTNGVIRIFLNFQDQLGKNERVKSLRQFQHRVLRWHKHPVSALTYLNPNLLLSGGEEAVMVSWQVGYTATGGGTMSTRPIRYLPRLFRGSGGITHIIPLDSNRVLAMSEGENALKMISAHEHKFLWHLGGLASNSKLPERLKDEVQITPSLFIDQKSIELTSLSHYGGDKHSPILQTCPVTNRPILSGLNGAPGFLHELSPFSSGSSRRIGLYTVSSELEVVVYNRVSRTETGESAKPSLIPRVSHFAQSSSGKVLVTVDKTLSELDIYGRRVKVQKDVISESTSLKFWARSNEALKGMNMPYHLDSVMTNPHGHANNISGLSLTRKGTRLVTISSTEDAFRLWTRDSSGKSVDAHGGWKCKFKISTPSSFSSCIISGAMAFNPVSKGEDESVLAIAYGNTIGLWDASVERDYPILLRSIVHTVTPPSNEKEKRSIIEKIIFTRANCGERIISISSYSICAQSLFPGVNVGWRYVAPETGSHTYKITAVEYIESRNEIAVAMLCQKTGKWFVQVLSESDGKPVKSWGETTYGPSRSQNKIISISADSQGNTLYFLTDSNKLFSINRVHSKQQTNNSNETVLEYGKATVPKLNVPSESSEISSKRARPNTQVNDKHNFDCISWSKGVHSSNLPILSGAFLRSILGDKLKKVSSPEDIESKDSDDSDNDNKYGSEDESEVENEY